MVCHTSVPPPAHLHFLLFLFWHVPNLTRRAVILFFCSILRLQRPDWSDLDGSLNDVHTVTCPQPLCQLDRHLPANRSSQILRPPSDAGAAPQPVWQSHGPQCRVVWRQLSVQASTLNSWAVTLLSSYLFLGWFDMWSRIDVQCNFLY